MYAMRRLPCFHDIVFATACLVGTFFVRPAFAASAIDIQSQNFIPVEENFILGPVRHELSLDPGEETTVPIVIESRLGRDARFAVEIEDFSAGDVDPVQLYGDAEGPFSARSWIESGVPSFTLKHGQRATLSVTVRVPRFADPGDHYTAVLIHQLPDQVGSGTVAASSRIGSLFLLRVNGDIQELGKFTLFESLRLFHWTYPIDFFVGLRNDGSVRAQPSGNIRIKNIFGREVGRLPVEDWRVLRNSSAVRAFAWDPSFAMGLYTAEAELAYSPSSDMTVLRTRIFVLPLLPTIILVLLLICITYALKNFRLVRRQSALPDGSSSKKKQ
jgi:hypothetical protein